MNAAKRPNIILCGFMATGKSVVGKQLATMIGYDFFDMDAMIETETGMSVRIVVKRDVATVLGLCLRFETREHRLQILRRELPVVALQELVEGLLFGYEV